TALYPGVNGHTYGFFTVATDNVGFGQPTPAGAEASSTVVQLAHTALVATGAGAGGEPHVKVYNADGSARFEFYAFSANFDGCLRVGTGEVDDDGVDDIITAAGPGGGPHVRVFNGNDGKLITEFFAYNPTFSKGVYVASGDIDGDGRAEIITGA